MDPDEDRYTRITLRIPKDLHAALTRLAAEKSRSMNAEIIDRLTWSVRDANYIRRLNDRLDVAIEKIEEFARLVSEKRPSGPDKEKP